MKNIVVVGGSSGIGLALVQNLREENVTVISRSACPVAGVKNLIADVTDERSLEKAFSSLSAIDVLVYCAGVSMAAPVKYVKTEDCRTLFDVNFIGAVVCVKLAMPFLELSDDGRIIFLSSSGGVAPIPFDLYYSASKAALTAFADGLNVELPHIKSTAVIIGGTRTRFSFKRKIYTDCDEYNAPLKAASDSLIKTEQTGYSADFVAKKISKIVYAKNPPHAETVGFKNKLMLCAYKIMPSALKRRALRAVYDL